MKLIVHQASRSDVYKDLVRIPGSCLLSLMVSPGDICKITVAECSALVSVWGRKTKTLEILMDKRTRSCLGLEDHQAYDFSFRRVWWFGQCKWAWKASNPSYRIAVRLGVVSIGLGFLSLILGLFK